MFPPACLNPTVRVAILTPPSGGVVLSPRGGGAIAVPRLVGASAERIDPNERVDGGDVRRGEPRSERVKSQSERNRVIRQLQAKGVTV